jgi:surface antigen
MSRSTSSIVAMFAALALAGCDVTSGDGGLGRFTAFSASPKSPAEGRATAALSSAAMGGLMNAKFAALLDEEDRRLAHAAQLEALDKGAAGAPVPWRNPASGRYGNIVPGPAYISKSETCRGYSHTVTIAGQIEIARGTACRVADDAPWSAAG